MTSVFSNSIGLGLCSITDIGRLFPQNDIFRLPVQGPFDLFLRFTRPTMTTEREERIISVLDKRQDNLTIVLENVFDPHNISAVMRTCDAVGVQDLFILNTKIPRHKKWGAKSSSSAAQWLTIHQYTDARECFTALRSRADRIVTTHLSGDALSLYQMDLT